MNLSAHALKGVVAIFIGMLFCRPTVAGGCLSRPGPICLAESSADPHEEGSRVAAVGGSGAKDGAAENHPPIVRGWEVRAADR